MDNKQQIKNAITTITTISNADINLNITDTATLLTPILREYCENNDLYWDLFPDCIVIGSHLDSNDMVDRERMDNIVITAGLGLLWVVIELITGINKKQLMNIKRSDKIKTNRCGCNSFDKLTKNSNLIEIYEYMTMDFHKLEKILMNNGVK